MHCKVSFLWFPQSSRMFQVCIAYFNIYHYQEVELHGYIEVGFLCPQIYYRKQEIQPRIPPKTGLTSVGLLGAVPVLPYNALLGREFPKECKGKKRDWPAFPKDIDASLASGRPHHLSKLFVNPWPFHHKVCALIILLHYLFNCYGLSYCCFNAA